MHPTRPAHRAVPRSSAAAELTRGLAAGVLFAAACLAWFTPALKDAGWALVQAVVALGR